MQPQTDDSQRNIQIPPRDGTFSVSPEREAATRLMRQQINSIYDDDAPAGNVYSQTHSETKDHNSSQSAQPASDWNQYHSAWQSYYQQYYERYYAAQVKRRAAEIAPRNNESVFAPAEEQQPILPGELTRDQAVNELRDKLINEVKERSHKVRKSRHFMPFVAAVSVALAFGLLQYNSLIVAQVKAYVSPGSIDPQNIVLDPTTNTKVSPEPKVVIPKINVDAPIVYDVPSLDEHVIQSKLKNGVVHYPIPGASGVPGQAGNAVFLGHSSNDVFDDGNYKFVFVQLDKLTVGDTFYLHYQGTRYTYAIKEKKVILPNQVSELVLPADKPIATLVTCTPAGTALKRLVVIGEQISPDPTGAAAVTPPTTEPGNTLPNIAGNSPTLLERLFGSDN